MPVAALLGMLLAGCARDAPVEIAEVRLLMGTAVAVTVRGGERAVLKEGVDAAYHEMQRLSDMMSHYEPTSVVSEINRQAGVRPVPVPPELMRVLTQARRVSRLSGGAFDVTIGALSGWRFDPEQPRLPDAETIAAQLPLVDYRALVLDPSAGTAFLGRRGMRLDLGGIAKLYILDAGLRVLTRYGIEQALIDGGGDVVVMGGSPERPWRIGIRDPNAERALLAMLDLRDGFVVSSGDYERAFIKDGRRYHHILDPRTGYPAGGPRQVTLEARRLDTVNGLSAAIMVLGSARGRALIERTAGLEGLIVDASGELWVSPGLKTRLRFPSTTGD